MLPIWLILQAKKQRDGYNPQKASRRRGMIRVGVYALSMMVLASTCAVQSARARTGDATLAIGRELLPLTEAMTNEITDVSLNGEHVFISNAITKLPISDILDRYEAHCRANPGAPASAWRALADAPMPDASKKKLFALSTLRRESPTDGMVTCLERGAETGSTLTDAIKRFETSHDLGALGKLRMAYVGATPNGQTHVLTVWTEDSFKFDHIAPPDGSEPPGQDFAGIPRPLGGKRMLSARIHGTPYAANVYRSAVAPEAIAEDYDNKLIDAGWVGMTPPVPGGSTRSYQKDGVFIHLGAKKDAEGTIATLGLMGVDGPASPGAPEALLGAPSK